MTDTTSATTKQKTQAQTYDNWIGREAVDPQGNKVGEINDVLYDDVTGRPEWVVVKAGLLGGRSIAPIAGASIRQTGIRATGMTSTSGTDPVVEYDPDDVQLVLAYSKDRIKHAPDVDPSDDNRDDDPEHDSPEGHLSAAENGSCTSTTAFAMRAGRPTRASASTSTRWLAPIAAIAVAAGTPVRTAGTMPTPTTTTTWSPAK